MTKNGLTPERSVFLRNLVAGVIMTGFGGVGMVANLGDRSAFLWSALFALAGEAVITFAVLTSTPDSKDAGSHRPAKDDASGSPTMPE